MANASRDQNSVPTLIGTLNSDGSTIVPVYANPTTHRLAAMDGTAGTDLGPVNAPRDGNNVPVLLAVSSVDGVTPVVVYADSSGRLLVQKS